MVIEKLKDEIWEHIKRTCDIYDDNKTKKSS